MIVGYHLIFGMYGFWLPNDPRGSWSEIVGSWDLYRYGAATKTTARHSIARTKHDHAKRLAAKSALQHRAVQLTGEQAREVGRGFANYFAKSTTPVWACAILPDHVHLVVGRSSIPMEQLVIQLKGSATRQLLQSGLHPFDSIRDENGRSPKCFARGEWKVYLKSEDVSRAIRYVEDNPLKENKPRQHWSFVVPHENEM